MQRNISLIILKQRYFNYEKNNDVERPVIVRYTGYKSNLYSVTVNLITGCNANCKNNTCDASNSCTEGCKDGYWGPTCTSNCSMSCFRKACEQTYGRCIYGCIPGRYGDMCIEYCDSKCYEAVCFQNGTCSRGCVQNWTGHSCNSRCFEMKWSHID